MFGVMGYSRVFSTETRSSRLIRQATGTADAPAESRTITIAMP